VYQQPARKQAFKPVGSRNLHFFRAKRTSSSVARDFRKRFDTGLLDAYERIVEE
jgi:hypothetical protein